MLNQWFYSHAVWQVAIAVCSVMVLVPLLGLSLFHRLVDWEAREHDTTMVGLSYALCGGIYAVLLAFVAVGTYETMDKTAAIASEEANSLGGLAFDSAGLPAGTSPSRPSRCRRIRRHRHPARSGPANEPTVWRRATTRRVGAGSPHQSRSRQLRTVHPWARPPSRRRW